jgi:hypothetical protein
MDPIRWALNRYALKCKKYDDVITVCGQGANNYAEIFWANEHDLKTCVYLINMGNVITAENEYISHKTMEFYIKAGAGAILNYYPIWRDHALAEPYIMRRKDITALLAPMLVQVVISIVFQYTSFDMPKLPDETMAKLESEYAEWRCPDPGPDSPLPWPDGYYDDDWRLRVPFIIDRPY